MERSMEWARRALLALRPTACCRVLPLRAGLLAAGYCNLVMAVVLIVGTASSTFVPMCVRVQEAIVEEASPSTCVLGPTAELALTVLLLAATHRSDVWLLRVYSWLSVLALVGSLLVYSLVVAVIGALYLIAIAASLVYQSYVLLLVRSFILEIRYKDSIDKSTLHYDRRLDRVAIDVEAPPPPGAEHPRSTAVAHTPETAVTTPTETTEKEKQCETVQVITDSPPTVTSQSVASTSQTTVSVHEPAAQESDSAATKPRVGAVYSLKDLSSVKKVNTAQSAATVASGRPVDAVEASEQASTEPSQRGEEAADTQQAGEGGTQAVTSEAAGVADPVQAPQKKKRGLFRRAAKDNSKKDGKV